jgi:hypothetical protein
MSEKLIPIPIVNERSDNRWNAWQARGAENDRATRRRMFLLLGALVLSGAVLSGLRWF